MPSQGLLMTRNEKLLALTQLFRDAGAAHHRAFLATNGDDPQWPQWYAAWLAVRMEALLGRAFDVPQLAQQLEALEKQRQSSKPAPDWPFFYAESFVD